MFGKLMKYELRGCMRVFLPLWGATLDKRVNERISAFHIRPAA